MAEPNIKAESYEEAVVRLGRVAGFAPGDYLSICTVCSRHFHGDKRAFHCLPCAVDRLLAGEREGWRPMESMPQDGTRVLVNFMGAGPIVAFKDPSFPAMLVRYLGYGKSGNWPTIHEDGGLGWQPLPPFTNSQP